MAGVKRRIETDSDIRALYKELDAVTCPICMDHPHNAVLLLCSSHEKGCRSYICDTSYRHSNCLDRFKKLRENTRNSPTLPSSLPVNHSDSHNISDLNIPLRTESNEANETHNLIESNTLISVNLPGPPQGHIIQDLNRPLEAQTEGVLEVADSESFQERVEHDELDGENSPDSKLSLKCPLCRGAILGWEAVEDVRKYLNLKKRSCSRESCSFSGNYQELRRHARRVHPTTRPSDIDPSRERAWQHLEHQREFGDVVSAIHSAIPGAVVVGDYVIENGDRLAGGGESGAGEANGPWWTTLFLFQMIGSVDRAGEQRARSRAWTRHRRSGALSERRFLWGENLLGLQDDEVDDEDDDDDENLPILNHRDLSPIPRRRRRLTRSRSDEDRP
ncbi:uncharacterized protein Pyn_13816 [Prunus yedoensis var. nudiflora]|uniref:DUF1644 domain-containing protein n=1 Tax=Prunus yedoensis var. nudiflora TaxID=2094558 RepID=A0A314UQ71_PRUYE|nr:uncharacterized protein Pyn_13816 [Prunus yedoensis var. nudiflora]